MEIIEETLKERGDRYGEFIYLAEKAQRIKNSFRERNDNGWENLSDDKKEALDMIAHKIARILNGNPEYADSWRDIAGYAQLVEKELSK